MLSWGFQTSLIFSTFFFISATLVEETSGEGFNFDAFVSGLGGGNNETSGSSSSGSGDYDGYDYKQVDSGDADQWGYGNPSSGFVDDLVQSPKARLYSGENFTGKFEDYTFANATFQGGCQKLGKLRGKVKSIDTFGKCVRIFQYSWCDGKSLAIYPGNDVISSDFPDIRSVGPCLAQEFKYSIFKDAAQKSLKKDTYNPRKYVPDLVEFYSHEKSGRGNISRDTSLQKFTLGPKNRIEFLRAYVTLENSNFKQERENEGDNSGVFQTLEDKSLGDVEGFGILPIFGGPKTKLNIFPQSIFGQLEWGLLTSGIRPFLENGGKYVVLAVNFVYEDANSARPDSFYYWIGYVPGGKGRIHRLSSVSYGRVQN